MTKVPGWLSNWSMGLFDSAVYLSFSRGLLTAVFIILSLPGSLGGSEHITNPSAQAAGLARGGHNDAWFGR